MLTKLKFLLKLPTIFSLLIFVAIFISLFFLISPWQEFPLNDDWVQSLGIYNYIKDGQVYYPTWLSSNLHFPIIYGIVLAKIFGFSFGLLRLSNLILSFLTIIIFYLFLRKNQLGWLIAFSLSLLLWFNPLFFNLSYTFMGDIPALFLLLLSLYLYIQGFKKINYWLIFFASLISILGFFTRQTALLLFVAAFIYYLTQKGFKKIYALWLFIFPALMTGAIYLLLDKSQLLPGKMGARILVDYSYWEKIVINGWHFLLLLTLFLLPITLSLFVKNFNWLKDKYFYLIFLLTGLMAGWAFYTNNLFPNLGNLISQYGLGPTKIVLQGDLNIWGGSLVYLIINIILILSLIINLYICRLYLRRQFIIDNAFYLIFIALYLILILPIYSFDRYLLMPLPLFLLFAGQILQQIKWSKLIFVIILILMTAYSLIGTTNYLAWNKVRWDLADQLLKQGVAAKDIEAGYEFVGWYLYQTAQKQPLANFTPTWAPWYIKEVAPGHLMEYIISFSPLGGYQVLQKQTVPGLFPNIKTLYLNKVNHSK